MEELPRKPKCVPYEKSLFQQNKLISIRVLICDVATLTLVYPKQISMIVIQNI